MPWPVLMPATIASNAAAIYEGIPALAGIDARSANSGATSAAISAVQGTVTEAIAVEAAARLASTVGGGSISAAGQIVLETGSGATIVLAGTLVTNLIAGTVTNVGPWGTPTVTITGSPPVVSFGIPQGLPGQNAIMIAGVASGPWDAATNVPALANGGAGAAIGTTYMVSFAGSTSIDGNSTWNVGDYITNAGGVAWVRVPNALASGVLSSITLPNATIMDDGINSGTLAILDLYGFVGLMVSSAGLAVGNFTSNTATMVTQTVGVLSVTGGASIVGGAAVDALTIGSNAEILDNGDGNGGLLLTDPYGFVALSVSPTGVVAFASLAAALASQATQTVGTLTVTSGASLAGGVAIDALTIGTHAEMLDNGDGSAGLMVLDPWGFVAFVVSGTGSVTYAGQYSSSVSTTYSAADIAQHHGINLEHSLRVRNRVNTTAQQTTANINLHFSYGQSKSIGQEGGPAITVTQPYDNIMFSQSTRPTTMFANASGVSTPMVDSNFHPLVSTNQVNGSETFYTFRTGEITALTGVTVNASTGVIAWTGGGSPEAEFEVGDTCQLLGFSVATGNNANGVKIYTITGLTTNSITVATGTGNTALQSTVSAENGIGIYQVNTLQFGEDLNVTAINELRGAQLRRLRLTSDPSRVLCVTNQGVSGQTIAQLSATGGDYTRVPSALGQIATAAAALAKTLLCTSILFHQGGTDAQDGTQQATYVASYQALIAQMQASIQSELGQTTTPFWFGFMIGGGELNDFDSTGTEYCPVGMGLLELFGCAPYNGFSTPYTPNMYLMGPDYYTTDHANQHLTGNGYRWSGAQFGKIMARVMEYGQGWLPLICIAASFRGSQVLLDFHVPEPPLQFGCPYDNTTPITYADAGFCVYDASGLNAVIGYTIYDTCIVLQCTRNIVGNAPNSAAPIVKYADALLHKGLGNICDSDPWVAQEVQIFNAGSGQDLGENLTAAASLTNPSQNGQPYPCWNWLCPFVAPLTAD
jgi:hypothetical protein